VVSVGTRRRRLFPHFFLLIWRPHSPQEIQTKRPKKKKPRREEGDGWRQGNTGSDPISDKSEVNRVLSFFPERTANNKLEKKKEKEKNHTTPSFFLSFSFSFVQLRVRWKMCPKNQLKEENGSLE
jgi:hypothetical protein